MSDDGILFTSLPTENVCYRLLRLVFGKTKPADHNHSAAEVEAMLRAGGFRKVMGLYNRLVLPAFPLFRISSWRKACRPAPPLTASAPAASRPDAAQPVAQLAH